MYIRITQNYITCICNVRYIKFNHYVYILTPANRSIHVNSMQVPVERCLQGKRLTCDSENRSLPSLSHLRLLCLTCVSENLRLIIIIVIAIIVIIIMTIIMLVIIFIILLPIIVITIIFGWGGVGCDNILWL